MGKIQQVSNGKCRNYVSDRLPFKGSNLHGCFEDQARYYVVYSYGWYPLWVYEFASGMWYENESKYSTSTSRHKSQTAPDLSRYTVKETKKLTTDQLKSLIWN